MGIFIGREKELSELDKLYNQNGFKFAVVYGRRRVGKSTMIHKFITEDNKPNISFMGMEQNNKKNLDAFSQAVLDKYPSARTYLNSFPNWEKVFDYIIEQAGNERLVLFIDEYPYIAKAYKTISSIFQKYADLYFPKTNILLILCGSSMSFMETQVLGGQSPLYGRRDMQFKVEPFDYFESAKFFTKYTNVEKAIGYGIAGGIPLYLQKISDAKTLGSGVITSFLTKNGALFEEPRNLLLQELREPAVYSTIIHSIANGATRLNEISTKSGEEGSKTSKYLMTLGSLHLIKKELPATEVQERNGIYSLSDNMFRFWYTFVNPNIMSIELGLGNEIYEQKILPMVNDYMGHIFEDICIQFLKRQYKQKKLPFSPDAIGRWWGNNPLTKNEQEIDIIAHSNKSAIFGECKWTNSKVDKSVYDNLEEKSKMFRQFNTKYFFLFSKSGFTQGLIDFASANSNISLIALDDIYRDVKVDEMVKRC